MDAHIPATGGTSRQQQHSRSLGEIKLLQINLNHTKKAMQAASQHIKENKIDVALLQDTYVNPNAQGLYDFPSAWRVFESKNKNAHVIISNTSIIANFLTSTDYAVFVSISAAEGDLIIGSFYAPTLRNQLRNTGMQDPFQSMLDAWSHLAQRQDSYFLCGGDYNANSQLWGSPRTDERGQTLMDFLVTNNLLLVNLDNRIHTFRKYDGRGTLLCPGLP